MVFVRSYCVAFTETLLLYKSSAIICYSAYRLNLWHIHDIVYTILVHSSLAKCTIMDNYIIPSDYKYIYI